MSSLDVIAAEWHPATTLLTMNSLNPSTYSNWYMFRSFLPRPHWPSSLSPAAYTFPSLVSASVWVSPHAASIYILSVGSSLGSNEH